ncbi:MAG TPA: DHA2 family efflux MFS transporter permease subunit [Acidimicrobiales bacterium]|nr:DHA2 family efflux MFS transporter permease subunit [Acidimicrobiales bacterium]
MRDPQYVHQRRWFTLLVLCVSLIVIVLDNTILNVALPTLAHPVENGGLGATGSQLQWIVDAYTIVFAGLLLTAGSLGDRFGRYKALTFGLSVFGIGSLLSAFATDADVLIATRALMGVGGAFIMPATLSVLTNVFTEARERGRAIGIWAGVSALGIGIGPISGGVLLAHFWWGSVFLVNVPIVILGLVFGYLLIPESRDPSAPRLDPIGALLSIVGLTTFLWAVIEAPSHGWAAPDVLAGFAIGTALLVTFLLWELHTPSPMLNMHFFQNPRFSAASGAITVAFFSLFGTLFLMTQYLQSVLGYSTIKAGAVLLPQAVTIMVAAPLSSVWVQRFGNKRVVAGGLLVVTAGFLAFLTLQPDSSTLHVILVTCALGLGMGNVMAPATDSIMGSLPRAKAGVGSAVNDTTRQVGGAFGVAVLGSILSSQYATHFTSRVPDGVPADAVDAAKDSVGAALGVANTLPSQLQHLAPGLIDAAKSSFVDGFHLAALIAAVLVFGAALGVLRFLPARGTDEEPADMPWLEAEPVASADGDVELVPLDAATTLAEAET